MLIVDSLSKRYDMKECTVFGIKNLYNEEYSDLSSKCINQTVKQFIITMAITLASFILGIIYPVYIWYRDGVFYTLAGVMIPFVEPNGTLDVTINVILQVIFGYNAFNGLVAIQTYHAIVLNSAQLSTEISRREIRNLTAHMERGNVSEALIHEYLTKIIRQIQRIDE